MPCLKEWCVVLSHKTRDTAEFTRSEAAIGHERHRFQPELSHLPITLHVNMRWFSAIRTEKDETVGTNLENRGHRALSLTCRFLNLHPLFYAERLERAILLPNASAHLLPEAGATQERTLEAVRCSARLCKNSMFW
jgi:hypothetical protein